MNGKFISHNSTKRDDSRQILRLPNRRQFGEIYGLKEPIVDNREDDSCDRA